MTEACALSTPGHGPQATARGCPRPPVIGGLRHRCGPCGSERPEASTAGVRGPGSGIRERQELPLPLQAAKLPDRPGPGAVLPSEEVPWQPLRRHGPETFWGICGVRGTWGEAFEKHHWGYQLSLTSCPWVHVKM